MNKEKEIVERILSIPTETRTLEFKRLGSDGVDKVLQTIVAMANTDGGTIILGVDDPEKTSRKNHERIFGIEENPNLFDEIGRLVPRISPPVPGLWPPDIIPVHEIKKNIGLLHIPKATENMLSFESHVYVRLERGNKRLSPQEIVHFSYIKGFQRADRELVDVDIKLLQTHFYEAWRKKRGIEEGPLKEILEKTGLIREDEKGKSLPTRAAVLLFAEYPSDLMDTKCSIRVFQYAGREERISETLNLIGTPKTIGGPVSKQINETHEYVLSLLRAGLRVPSGFVTQYLIPERAIKEAITNAVIHRDYHTKRDIEIKIFEDRVAIESPGLFPFNITPANIGIIRARGYRNDLLVKHLRELPDPPNLDQNEGVRAMRQTMNQANLYPPIFMTYPYLQDAVRVILLNLKAPSEWDKVSAYLTKNRFIANHEARKLLNIGDTVKMSKFFRRWVKQGLLVAAESKKGAKRNMRYRLPATDERTLFTGGQGK